MACGDGDGAGKGFKGGGCNCCCDRCDHLTVKCHECCYCVCRSLCVTLDTGPTGSASQAGCDNSVQKVDWDCDTNSYHDTTRCGSISVDYSIVFRKLDDGNCYMCLESNCFRSEDGQSVSTESQCILMAEPPDTECSKLSGAGAGTAGSVGGTWTFDLAECSAGEVSAADGMSVTMSIECVDYISPVGFGCDPDCDECECTCDCVCINYNSTFVDSSASDDESGSLQGNACTESEENAKRTCWSNSENHWQAIFDCPSSAGDSQTLTVTIEENSDGICSLILDATLGTVVDPRQSMDCPDIYAVWTIEFDDGTEAAASIECDWCNDCKSSQPCPCCQGTNIPHTLTATISEATLEANPELTCECAEGTIELTYVPDQGQPGILGRCEGQWEGEGDWGCGGPPLQLTLRCDGGDSFSLSSVPDDVCLLLVGASATGDCDPFFLQYGTFPAPDCCTGGGDINITITE